MKGIGLDRHLDALFSEYPARQTIYGCPGREFFRGFPDLDLSVRVHDQRIHTPLGPSAGPHTQLAQNILLSFLCGGRFMELKTVQVKDELEIPRPCIDARNVCFNVEWSQELKLEDSRREYVKAWVLLKILEASEVLGRPAGDPFYDAVLDLSVGYDLEGISSPRIANWIRGLRSAEEDIEKMLKSLPRRHYRFRKLAVPPEISRSVTVSTFHGCPKDEIETIVRYLMEEHGLHVTVKMNPTFLGYERVRKILHEELGYTYLRLDPKTFSEDLSLEDAKDMMRRLRTFADSRGKGLAVKFTNTLVVKNHDRVLPGDVMYLSGPPLHVLAMECVRLWGDSSPVSFSAGVARGNVVETVSRGLAPVTICTDLLKNGGYTRMNGYLEALAEEMRRREVRTIADLVRLNEGRAPSPVENPKYHRSQNEEVPKKVDRKLTEFDCLTCDICISVCPNAAVFDFPMKKRELGLVKDRQIGILSEFCNRCGNCGTFCPERGAPYAVKPHFFLERSGFDAGREDGFCLADAVTLLGRVKGVKCSLHLDENGKVRDFHGPGGEAGARLQRVMKAVLEGVRGSAWHVRKLAEGEAFRSNMVM